MFGLKEKLLFASLLIVANFCAVGQINIHQLLASGVEDTQTFSSQYFVPGTEAMAFSLSNGWFTSAKSKNLFQIELSFIGNFTSIEDTQKRFQLNTNDYNFLEFNNGFLVQDVANVLSENNPEIPVSAVFEDENGFQQSVAFNLPQGILEANSTSFTTVVPQLNIGFIAGFEFKLRYLPKINLKDATIQLYGFGVQHELSRWFPILKSLPLQVAIAANYTQFRSDVNLGETPIVDVNNGRFYNELKVWNYSTIISKKILFAHIYAGITYLDANATFGLKGDFNVNQGVIAGAFLQDPFLTSTNLQGWRKTIGLKLSLAFFKVNIDYNIQEYNTISGGISFGI